MTTGCVKVNCSACHGLVTLTEREVSSRVSFIKTDKYPSKLKHLLQGTNRYVFGFLIKASLSCTRFSRKCKVQGILLKL